MVSICDVKKYSSPVLVAGWDHKGKSSTHIFFFFLTSKAFLLTVRARVSFCSLGWPFGLWHARTSGPWNGHRVWCGCVEFLGPCQSVGTPLGPSEDQTRAQCPCPWETPGPAGRRSGSYPQPWGSDFGPGCSPSVHTPSAWALPESAHHLWSSPQPQQFCSPDQEASSSGSFGTGTEVAG